MADKTPPHLRPGCAPPVLAFVFGFTTFIIFGGTQGPGCIACMGWSGPTLWTAVALSAAAGALLGRGFSRYQQREARRRRRGDRK